MRIVFTVTNDLTYDRRMQRICSSLAQNGNEVTLVGRELKQSLPIDLQKFKQERIKCWFTKGKLFYLEYNLRLLYFLYRFEADIYGAVDLDTIIPNVVMAKRKKKHCVYDAHEYFSEVPEVVGRPLVKRIWEWVADRYIPQVDLAYTVGDGLAEIFTDRYQTPFDTIRNVPIAPESYPPLKEGKYLLYQGALNMGRGLESLLEAMQEIDMPLKIAGEGDLSGQLRQQVKDLGVEDKVEFLGFVSPENLPSLTENAYLGLNLLENKGLSYYYSLANKCFDYIQSGVPAINMAFPEYVKLNEKFEISVLINEIKPYIISSAINDLLSDTQQYNILQQNCLEARKVFNWQQEEVRLLALYQQFE